MIKSLIILVLLVLLCGGAYLSRPSEADFREFVQKQSQAHPLSVLVTLFDKPEKYTFKDRYLWVTVEQGGQTRYLGAFSQFWPVNRDAQGAKAEQPAPAAAQPAPPPEPVKEKRRPPMWD
jgi:hypothetical protein